MKRIKLFLIVSVISLSLSFLVGCFCKCKHCKDKEDVLKRVGKEKVISIGILTDKGGIHDESFSQSAWEGAQKAKKELGDSIKLSYLEPKTDADIGPYISKLSDQCELVIVIGFAGASATKDAAIKNPKNRYVLIDSAVEGDIPPNLTCIVYQDHQGSFLIGYIAGHLTKSNKVVFIGGVPSKTIDRFYYGYSSGVFKASQELNKRIDVLSFYSQTFVDASKVKAIALNACSSNVDILFHATGPAGTGVFEAIKDLNDANKLVIGVDRDQSYLAPKNTVTSLIKNTGASVESLIKSYFNKEEGLGGSVRYWGLENGAYDIVENNIPKEILAKVKVLKQEIIEKKENIPQNSEEFNRFKSSISKISEVAE